ncbi:MAG: DNA polymerase III subunit gamma/tau [Patescibacteria group bacterium]|nr:DNA polymerase III subunit gamma/tau [Patescibacteria group bacterium]
MGQALYRKYRSKSLPEIIGQEHITDTLSQALKQNKISHAYLFTGPRGVGKTSIARILAHEINGLAYTDDSAHLDIIEIDAASNRRIDEIRELRDKVYIAPTSAKYKVYIIDEVHMLTREAFNALLKTLEEPPAHAVFILATTDAHKLPDTIVSRTQRYNFKPVATAAVSAHLKHIAKSENISVSDAAIELLAKHGEGSFRDSISLLDQASGKKAKLELRDIETLLGLPSDEAVRELVTCLQSGSSSEVAVQLNQLLDQGFHAAAIAKQISALLRDSVLANNMLLDKESIFTLLQNLLEVPISPDPGRYLELILLQTLTYSSSKESKTQSETAEPTTKSTTNLKESKKNVNIPADEPDVKVIPDKSVPVDSPKKVQTKAAKTDSAAVAVFDQAVWPAVLTALKQKHNTLYGVVRMAEPTFSAVGVVLTFQFAFHQKRINEASNRQKLANIITELTGQDITIECLFDKQNKSSKTALGKSITAPNKTVSAISNIFGGGELIDS